LLVLVLVVVDGFGLVGCVAVVGRRIGFWMIGWDIDFGVGGSSGSVGGLNGNDGL
jgi:hypothetical protein